MKIVLMTLFGALVIASCSTPPPTKAMPVATAKNPRRATLKVRLPAQTGQIGDQAFAKSIDQYVGKYVGENKNGEVMIKKVMTKAPDLFKGAKYKYTISMDYTANKGPTVWLEDDVLIVDKAARALTLSKELECDDPGCWYTYADVTLKINKKGEPFVELTYTSSVPTPDDPDMPTEAEGRKLFFKE